MTESVEAVRDEFATRRLAEFCAGLTVEDLDEEVRDDVALSLLDTLAASYAGVDSAEGDRLLAYVRSFDGAGDAAVLGTDIATIPEFAAMANGTTAHALEVDDGHREASAHPGSPVVPAALAMAATTDASGADLLTAVAAGYEAMLTVATAVQPSHRQRGFHATATTGCFGAAAAAASVLDLDAGETADALGLAGTQAGGLFEFLAEGSMAKRFHPGRAAMAGVVAARLAAVGFDGPNTVVEGEDGFARAFTDEYDLAPLDKLGDPFQVTRRYVKPYPCCRHIHGPIDATKAMLADGLDPDAVTGIRVETYRNAAYHDKTDIRTLLDAQMSIPYAVAVTLDSGEARITQFDPPRTDDERVARLIDAVEVVETEAMDELYPESRPATLVAETADGTHEEFVEYPLGAPENPLSRAAFETKFHDLTADALPEADRDWLLEAAYSLADLEDAAEFLEQL